MSKKTVSKKIPFESYSWSFGTTSFRVKELKYYIEKQLFLLQKFNEKYKELEWNNEAQEIYSELLTEEGLFEIATMKEKNARVKTSSLVDLGLINEKRELTQVGNKIIKETAEIKFNKTFNIRKDSYIYLKQLLKYQDNDFNIKPFLAIIYSCIEFDKMDFDFFAYILPQCKTKDELLSSISKYKGKKDIYEITYNLSEKSIEKHKELFDTYDFKNKFEFDVFILSLLPNRKSSDYSKSAVELYKKLLDYWENLKNNKYNDDEKYNFLKETDFSDIKDKAKIKLNKFMFGIENLTNKSNKKEIISKFESSRLMKSKDIQEFTFNYAVLFAFGGRLANLEEYKDLNLRYIKLTDIFIIENNQVELDLLPKYIFKQWKNLLLDTINYNNKEYQEKLEKNQKINEIYDFMEPDMDLIVCEIKKDYPNSDISDLSSFAKKIKEEKFKNLIETKFKPQTVIDLLNLIEKRSNDKDDKEILEKMNCDTSIPTVFEYLSGISLYWISEKKCNLFEILNLYLDANLLPQRFASGLKPDLLYKNKDYDILIEVTLSKKDNQRKMELEPVTRHLGKYCLENKNKTAYCIFIAPYLDPNVLVSFRSYKKLKYYNSNNTSEFIDGLNIIPISIKDLIYILGNNFKYSDTENKFCEILNSDESDGYLWYENKIKKIFSK